MDRFCCADCGHSLELVQNILWSIDTKTGKVFDPQHRHYTRCTNCGDMTNPNIVIPVVTAYGT